MVLRILPAGLGLQVRGFHPLWPAFPKPFSCPHPIPYAVHTPRCTHHGLGSFPFARRYSGNRCFFLFLRLLRCFSSPGSPCMAMDSPCSDRSFSCRVSPFRNRWVRGYLLLTSAYRSLSRLSSALSAKASTLRSFLLNHSSAFALTTLHSVAGVGSFGSLHISFRIYAVCFLLHIISYVSSDVLNIS